jgi:uncharacterized phage protein (TIGR01671 family)
MSYKEGWRMREIKYRAWVLCEHEASMKDVVVLSMKGKDGEKEDEFIVTYGNCQYYTHEYTLMQYTGLKDKNGKEIYEGDVLKSPSKILEVGYDAGQTLFYDHDMQIARATNYIENLKWVEIIGNIYENPELLDDT